MRWLLGILLMLAVALVIQSGLLAYTMYVLLGAFLFSRLLVRHGLNRVSARRTCEPREVEAGERVEVEVTLHNSGPLPIPWVLLEDLLPEFALAQRRPIGDVRLTHRPYEDPPRIAGVRAYQPGDPLNRIHWKVTARSGRLHSKIYDPTTMAGATILLDFPQAGYPSRGEPHRSDLAVTAAASLAHAVTTLGQQGGLATNG